MAFLVRFRVFSCSVIFFSGHHVWTAAHTKANEKIVPDSHSSCLDKNKCTFSTTHWTFQFKSITKRNITLHKSLNWMFLITFLNRPHGFEILSYVRVRGLFKGQKWTYLLFYSSDHRRPCKACWADQAVRGTSEIPLLLCEWSSHSLPETTGIGQLTLQGTWHLDLWVVMAFSKRWILSRIFSSTPCRSLMFWGRWCPQRP